MYAEGIRPSLKVDSFIQKTNISCKQALGSQDRYKPNFSSKVKHSHACIYLAS